VPTYRKINKLRLLNSCTCLATLVNVMCVVDVRDDVQMQSPICKCED